MTKFCVGISGINATDNPGPGVPVARSLAGQGHDLIGLSYDVHDPGHYLTELFRNSFLLPYPSKGWASYWKAIQEVQEKSGMNCFIPCLDAELPLIIRRQSEFSRMGIHTFLPSENQFELRSKDQLPSLAKELKCNYPKTAIVNSLDELQTLIAGKSADTFPLPAYVKGKYYKAYYVQNIQNALLKGGEIAAEWGYPLLLQECVYGYELNLVGLGDGNGALVGKVAIKKQLTTQLGKVWTGVTIHDEALDRLAERFCSVTRWKGPFELECIRSPERIDLIEINPRFPAWVYFATAVGINLPLRLLSLMTTGDCEKGGDYPAGKFLVRQTSEFVTDLHYFQNLLAKNNREGQ